MFESVNTKFADLKCAKCDAALPIGEKCRVQVDVGGWLLWAECLAHEAKPGSTAHAPGCQCGFCKAGFTD